MSKILFLVASFLLLAKYATSQDAGSELTGYGGQYIGKIATSNYVHKTTLDLYPNADGSVTGLVFKRITSGPINIGFKGAYKISSTGCICVKVKESYKANSAGEKIGGLTSSLAIMDFTICETAKKNEYLLENKARWLTNTNPREYIKYEISRKIEPSTLFTALEKGDASALRKEIRDLNKKEIQFELFYNQLGFTVLEQAIRSGSVEMTRILLDAGMPTVSLNIEELQSSKLSKEQIIEFANRIGQATISYNSLMKTMGNPEYDPNDQEVKMIEDRIRTELSILPPEQVERLQEKLDSFKTPYSSSGVALASESSGDDLIENGQKLLQDVAITRKSGDAMIYKLKDSISLEKNEFDSAFYYYKKAKNLPLELFDSNPENITGVYSFKGKPIFSGEKVQKGLYTFYLFQHYEIVYGKIESFDKRGNRIAPPLWVYATQTQEKDSKSFYDFYLMADKNARIGYGEISKENDVASFSIFGIDEILKDEGGIETIFKDLGTKVSQILMTYPKTWNEKYIRVFGQFSEDFQLLMNPDQINYPFTKKIKIKYRHRFSSNLKTSVSRDEYERKKSVIVEDIRNALIGSYGEGICLDNEGTANILTCNQSRKILTMYPMLETINIYNDYEEELHFQLSVQAIFGVQPDSKTNSNFEKDLSKTWWMHTNLIDKRSELDVHAYNIIQRKEKLAASRNRFIDPVTPLKDPSQLNNVMNDCGKSSLDCNSIWKEILVKNKKEIRQFIESGTGLRDLESFISGQFIPWQDTVIQSLQKDLIVKIIDTEYKYSKQVKEYFDNWYSSYLNNQGSYYIDPYSFYKKAYGDRRLENSTQNVRYAADYWNIFQGNFDLVSTPKESLFTVNDLSSYAHYQDKYTHDSPYHTTFTWMETKVYQKYLVDGYGAKTPSGKKYKEVEEWFRIDYFNENMQKRYESYLGKERGKNDWIISDGQHSRISGFIVPYLDDLYDQSDLMTGRRLLFAHNLENWLSNQEPVSPDDLGLPTLKGNFSPYQTTSLFSYFPTVYNYNAWGKPGIDKEDVFCKCMLDQPIPYAYSPKKYEECLDKAGR